MRRWIAFWNILAKDMRAYYLKPPNISWGIIFPLAWTGMFFIRSGSGLESVLTLLPGVITISVLFGTTSMLAVTITFEKRSRSFERLLLAPISLELLMLAKTSGAILFGVANAFVPIVIAAFLTDLSGIAWSLVVPAILLIGIVSTFLGLFIAVSVSEVFEAQTFSNFFRFVCVPRGRGRRGRGLDDLAEAWQIVVCVGPQHGRNRTSRVAFLPRRRRRQRFAFDVHDS